jgi:hypothetical protein
VWQRIVTHPRVPFWQVEARFSANARWSRASLHAEVREHFVSTSWALDKRRGL